MVLLSSKKTAPPNAQRKGGFIFKVYAGWSGIGEVPSYLSPLEDFSIRSLGTGLSLGICLLSTLCLLQIT